MLHRSAGSISFWIVAQVVRAGMAALLVGVACLVSGCALVPIPYPRAVPGPVRAVRVLDARTGVDIPDATLDVRAVTYKNWMAPTGEPGLKVVEDPAPPTEPPAVRRVLYALLGPLEQPLTGAEEVEEHSVVVAAARQPDGSFRLGRRVVVCAVRPWGIGPLGCLLWDDYKAVVTVSAPGYQAARVTYYPATPPKPGWASSKPGARCAFGDDGVLQLYLEPGHVGSTPAGH